MSRQDLAIGARYQVIRDFRDYDGAVHPVGETWWFRGSDFLPYEDGHTIRVSFDGSDVRSFRMQDRPDAQGAFFADVAAFVRAAPVEPPPPAAARSPVAPPPPAPAAGTSPAPAVEAATDAGAPSPPAAAPPVDGRAATTAPSPPSRSSLRGWRVRRQVAQTGRQASARRLRRNPPPWLVPMGLTFGAIVVVDGFRARARGEDIEFGRFGSYNHYPWWCAVVFGAVMIGAAIVELAKRRSRQSGAPPG